MRRLLLLAMLLLVGAGCASSRVRITVMVDETTVGREPITIVELEQDQCRLLFGESPCTAILGTTGVRKCFNTRQTCQDPENYDSKPTVVDTATIARDAVPAPWEIRKAGPTEASFDVSNEAINPNALFFKDDGTKLYIVGIFSDKVHQYPLSTAWDVSTAGAVEASFDVSGEETSPAGLFFKDDGTKLYIVGAGSDQVHQYPLTTAWDISTAGAVEASFSVAGEEISAQALSFKSDGTKLYVMGLGSIAVNQYPLTTAWDISTAGAVEASFDLSNESNSPHGIFFKDDGTKLYTVEITNDKAHQYSLSTPWDVSTGGPVEASFDVSGEDTSPRGLFFKPDGTKLYIMGDTTDTVYQYPVVAADLTIEAGPTHIDGASLGFGQGLNFAGTGAVKGTGLSLNPGPDNVRTIETKFRRPAGASTSETLLGIATDISLSSSDQIAMSVLDDGRLEVREWDGSTAQDLRSPSGVSYNDGKWHTISYVRTATDTRLLVDGNLVATGPAPLALADFADINLGVGGTQGIAAYSDDLDEVRFWSTARTDAEIAARVVLPLSGREAGLTAYYPLDDDPPAVATRTLRFAKPQTSLPRNLYLLPLLTDVSTAPTRLNPGGGSRDRGVLGDRASVDISFRDAPGSDRVVDKYRAERITGAAQTDEGGYQPLDRGSFWAKWRARNPFYQNRRVRVLEGYVGQELEDMQRREYFIDSLDGPDADGRVRLRAKDVLKLADDERAQAPRATPGELTATLVVGETTSFQATGAVIADYPDEPGLVRIGDEVIEYQTRTQATADNVEFQTLSRGARGTEAAEHDAEDRVQRCLEFVNVLPWKLVEDLLVNFGNVPASFVPIADWDAEGDTWLSQFTMTSVITEPTPVIELVSEITQQAQFFIWWDEHTQTIKLKALRAPTETPVALDDDSHLIEGASVLSEEPEQRISEVWVFFKQRDPTKDLDEEGNYARVRIRADLDAESAQQYGEQRIQKVFSRWLESETQAIEVTTRTLQRFRDNPRVLRIRVDAKDRATLRTGEVADVETRTVVDDRGVALSTRWQVIATREEPAGEAVELELLIYEFTGRFAFYMDSTAPTFANATEEEKKFGAWYADDNGKMSDGTEGYKYH